MDRRGQHAPPRQAEKSYETLPDERLPYMRFGESTYGFQGQVYEMQDFVPPAPDTLKRLRAITDEAFGRSGNLTEKK